MENMAKVTGVFTSMKGKVGGAVMQTWKGVQVMRTHVIPANPQSAGQTTNRTAFTGLVEMFKPILASLVHRFWNPFVTSHQTGWANLIGVNQAIAAGGVLDHSTCVVARGSLPDEIPLTATYDTATGAVVATWADSGAEGSLPGDFAMLIAYDTDTGKWGFSDGAALRSEETETCALPIGLTPANVFAYIFFFTGVYATPGVESVSNSNALVTSAS